MNSAIVVENFIDAKRDEYVGFVERLGADIGFSSDKWVCDKLRRTPSEKANMYTLYFHRIPMPYRETAKYFAAISLIRGKSIATAKTYIDDLDLTVFLTFGLPETKMPRCTFAMNSKPLDFINTLKSVGWRNRRILAYGHPLICFSRP